TIGKACPRCPSSCRSGTPHRMQARRGRITGNPCETDPPQRAARGTMSGYTELKLYIDGTWIGTEKRRTHRVINPATGGSLGELPLVDAADLDRALETTERAFRAWKRSTVEERSRVLKGAAQLMRETRAEALAVANLFEFFGEECRRAYGRVLVRPTGTRSLVVKEPVGPVAAFAPWNFPIINPGRK